MSGDALQRLLGGERTLRRADLSGANLAGTNISSVDLARANLDNADLSGANLSVANLSRVNFRRADLTGANLTRADLTDANLSPANLTGADLSRANLTGANLTRANLTDANLTGANLTGANLGRANLTLANLRGANLGSANLDHAFLGATVAVALDLSVVRGLTACHHFAASHLGERTLELSRGQIPEAFLRGVGFSDWQIEVCKLYDPALRSEQRNDILCEIHRLREGNPIVFNSVFISHSSADEAFCARLHADLQKAGVRCWFAPHDAKGGQKLHEQIERAIHMQDRLLLVLSTASMSSNWVKTEIANARAKEREQQRNVLFPIRLVPYGEIEKWKVFDADAGTDTGREVREYLIPDFSGWRDSKKYKSALDALVRDLRAPDAVASAGKP